MKTVRVTFFNLITLRCERFLHSLLSSFSFGRLYSLVRSKLSSLTALVRQGTLATLLAKSNVKAYVAVLLIAGLSPFFEVVYKFFDPHGGNPDSYWNTYYFLNAIGPHVSLVLSLTGCFLLLSKNNKLRFILIIPVAYKIAQIAWYCVISSNTQYHAYYPIGFLFIGLSVSVLWFMLFNWMLSLHFHKREGTIARIIGIINAPNVDDHKKVEIAQGQIKALDEL